MRTVNHAVTIRTLSCTLSKAGKHQKNLNMGMTSFDLLPATPAAVFRIDCAVVVRFWKHEPSLNITVEIQATNSVDLGQDDSRGGNNMVSDAEDILNVNPVRPPDNLAVGCK